MVFEDNSFYNIETLQVKEDGHYWKRVGTFHILNGKVSIATDGLDLYNIKVGTTAYQLSRMIGPFLKFSLKAK